MLVGVRVSPLSIQNKLNEIEPVDFKFCGYRKTRVKRSLSKRPHIGFQAQLSLNAGQNYCRMLQGEHSAILSTFVIKLRIVINIFVMSSFDWPFKTGFTVLSFVGSSFEGFVFPGYLEVATAVDVPRRVDRTSLSTSIKVLIFFSFSDPLGM